MTAATVSVSVTIPTSDKKAQEVAWASRALELAAQAIRSQGGLVTSGNINDATTSLGTWTYTPGAST
jgi:hypothetical protein